MPTLGEETAPAAREAAGADETETDLIERAWADRAAFAPLYERYFDPVYRYCWRRLGDREAAADATAGVFAAALAALPRYRPGGPGSFRAWLFAIAHNAVVDGHRRRRPAAPLEAAGAVADAAPGPEERALAAEADRSVTALLAALPEEQRRVVELRLAGLSGAEVAAVLGRSLASVKSAQFRAYARLRRLVAEEHRDDA